MDDEVLSESFDEEERDRFDDLEGTMRLQERPLNVSVNSKTGEMMSRTGLFSEGHLAEFGRVRRERLASYQHMQREQHRAFDAFMEAQAEKDEENPSPAA